MSISTGAYSSLAVETPENISLDYELAGPATRMSAYFIDLMILSSFFAALFWTFSLLEFSLPHALRRHFDTVAIIIVSVIYVFGGYFILFEFVMNGQTPGKRVMGIRTRMRNGTPVTLSATIARNFFRFSDCSFPFQYAAGCLCLVFTRNTQRVGDLVASTVVVKEIRDKAASKFRWRPWSGKPGLSGHIQLSREEFDMFIEYVNIHSRLSPAVRSRLCRKLIQTILEKKDALQWSELEPLLKEMQALPPDEQYKKGELVMRDILRYYLAS